MHFIERQTKYSCLEFYTASKSYAGVPYAAISPSFSEYHILHPEASICTAEAYAILSAVKRVRKLNLQKAVVFTGSLSVGKYLISLQEHKNSVINYIYLLLCATYASNQLVISWVPGHRDLEGNVLADEISISIATKAINNSRPVPAMDLK